MAHIPKLPSKLQVLLLTQHFQVTRFQPLVVQLQSILIRLSSLLLLVQPIVTLLRKQPLRMQPLRIHQFLPTLLTSLLLLLELVPQQLLLLPLRWEDQK